AMDRAALVFVRMTEVFGETFVHKYGEEDDGTWAAMLEGVSDRQTVAGLDQVRDYWTSEWPPTPGRFRAIALDSIRAEQIPVQRRIPPIASPEVEAAGLEKLRQLRRGLS
ncbi:MAG TPA: hypothetical protein VLA56_21220, partial [Pseudomonadales bacterium]|nr:hypothetical protein [Pseudomonadales bacterium]